MSRRAVLWIAFAIVHVAVAVLGFVLPNQPMGDVHNVYDPWSTAAISGHGIVGITETWVYPQLALVPMVLAQGLAWIAGYEVAWAILVTLIDALAFAVLIGTARSAGRRTAAWYWLAFIALLGPVGMYRLDGITVPLALAGCLWLVGRPWLGSILLAVATWIKVWPAALLAAAVIAVRRRFAVIGGALAVSVATLAVVFAAGGGAHAFGFITDQADRGLQLEAPVSAWYLWRAVFGIPGSYIYYDNDLLTFQVAGPAVDVVISVMTPLLVIAVAGIAGLGAYRAWHGASFVRLFPPLGLALVLAFILFNKVGSPQYMTWIIAPLVVGLVVDRHRWWGPASLGLAIALLTQIVYPLVYWQLLDAELLPAILLTLRNLLIGVLLVWAVVRVGSVPRRTPTLLRTAAIHP
ncbi:glycosyltransferase 87 family protein [Microbacterium sp. cf046]|uniref:glycosyltransferase 87 family protein n=1 Tax=Microbacterium sp. cf046 TaxID=1761803 RepID=UPI0020C87423|nr:glycosyltransferase 87 family protein [Microbacterium sp. cf046]